MAPGGGWPAIKEAKAVPPGSPAHKEIGEALVGFGLDIARWDYYPASVSSWARSDGAARAVRKPYLDLGFRRAADYFAQGFDPHSGNWHDVWPLTNPVRDAVNAILQRHGYDSDYIATDSYIFAYPWEKPTYFEIGHRLKPEIRAMVDERLPPLKRGWLRGSAHLPTGIYFGSYWGTESGVGGQYNLLFADKLAADNAAAFEREFSEAASELFRLEDVEAILTDYRVGFAFWHSGMPDLPPLYRED